MSATQLAKTMNGKAVEELDVLVVGAGFAGLYHIDRLRRLGHNVKVFEAGSDIGGVWYWNCLPKSALDVSDQERQATYEDLWNRGGFFPWIGTYQDVLSNDEANDTAYAFWRDKASPLSARRRATTEPDAGADAH
jgi:cation diffusion facilitator CzcD-associated flavoprotein CzcO